VTRKQTAIAAELTALILKTFERSASLRSKNTSE